MPKRRDPPVHLRPHEEAQHAVCIKVIGVGGGGNNAVNRMIEAGSQGIDFISADTDLQFLRSSKARTQLQLGAGLTHGPGAGADAEIVRQAVLEDSDKIIEALEGAQMVFIVAGLGGGAGTGAAPVIASIASKKGALTVAVVTRPFTLEGKRRMNRAERGLQELLDHVDTLLVISNDRLLTSASNTGFFESFRIADEMICRAVRGVSDIITIPGLVNQGFADVKMTLGGMGYAAMGAKSRAGPHRAAEAAHAAVASPLLEAGALQSARGIIFNITGSSSLKFSEVSEAFTIIQAAAHVDANILTGAVLDEGLGDEIMITVIAAGCNEDGRDSAERRWLERDDEEQTAESHAVLRPEPTESEPVIPSPAMALADNAHLLLAATRTPFHYVELQDTGDISIESPASVKSPPFELNSEQEPFDTSPSGSSAVAEDEEFLANIDGPPFDSDVIAGEPAPTQAAQITVRGIAGVRQAAMAAYTAMSMTQMESEVPIPREAGSFAEILESKILDVDEAKSDHVLARKVLPQQEPATSTSSQRYTNEGNEAASEVYAEARRSYEFAADSEIEQPSGSEFFNFSSFDGLPESRSKTVPASTDFPATQPATINAARSPTPDFAW